MAFTAPTAAEFKARYPTFAGTPDDVVQLALDDAAQRVGADWSEADQTLACSYLAAHNLTLDGHGTMAKTAAHRAAGVQSMKSGTMSVEFARTEEGASLLRTTSWGARYLEVVGRYLNGPFAVGTRPCRTSHLAQDLPYICTRRW